MQKYRRVLFGFSQLVLICSTELIAAEPKKSQEMNDYILSLDNPIELRGDYFLAAMAAYNLDFKKFISIHNTHGLKSSQVNDSALKLRNFLSKIENYDIFIESAGDNFEVSFGPTVRDNAPEVIGGSAQYLIDGRAFRILKKKYSK